VLTKIIKWIPFFLLFIPFRIFSFLNKKNVVVFGTGTGIFHDNPKYLFLFIMQNRVEYDCYWIAKNKQTYTNLKESGYPVIYQNSIKAARYCAIASAYVISAEIFDVFYFINDRTKLIQLWHGTPIKKSGMDYSVDRSNQEFKRKVFGKNYLYKRFDLISVDLSDFICIYNSFFGISTNKIKVYGQPRNYYLLNDGLDDINKIKQNLNLTTYDKLILFAPTFRDNISDNIFLIKKLIDKTAHDYLKKHNYCLLLKLHPFLIKYNSQIFPYETEFPNILNVSKYLDIQELMLIADILITDFSSVALDFMVTGKPVNIFAPDRNLYVKERKGFYNTISLIDECFQINSLDEINFEKTKIIEASFDLNKIIDEFN
jgi:CDP-glycerol glycerophosphotransferase